MVVWTKSEWTNGKKTVKGKWTYIWSSEKFYIVLEDGTNFYTYGEHPEWDNFKRIKELKDV